MWEHTLIESKGSGRSSKRWWAFPAAAGFHIAMISIVIVAAYWHVEAVEAPPSRFTYFNVIPVTVSPPPKLGGGQTATRPTVIKKQQPADWTQPAEVPLQANESSFSFEEMGPENPTGFENAPPGPGDPNGVDGGIGTGRIGNGVFDTSEEPRIVTGGIVPPVLLKRVEPDYPRAAIATRLEGMVVLEAVITKNGDVEQVKTLRSDNVLLERAAVDAVLQWKYKPALVQGRPVKVYFTVTVTFQLR